VIEKAKSIADITNSHAKFIKIVRKREEADAKQREKQL
jgi:hypothetical protein